AFFAAFTTRSKQFGITPLVLASFSLLSPLLGGSAYWYLMKSKRFCELERKRGSAVGFTGALVLLLLLFGAVPAFGLFKFAHDIQMVSIIKQAQLQMAKRLVERTARVENEYRQIFRDPAILDDWCRKRCQAKLR